MFRIAIAVCLLMKVSLLFAQTIEQQVQMLADDYANDPSLRQEVTFGIRINQEDWTIHAVPAPAGGAARVTVEQGAPSVPAFVYITDEETFARIIEGELQGLTAMAQARSSDPVPMGLEIVNDLKMDEAVRDLFLSVSFHFFTRGAPEVVPLGPEFARIVHGGEALPIYYDKQLRTSWYGIAPGQHINEDPADQVNDFSSLFIIIEKGSARARIGGRELELHDDQAVLVPAGVSHEFWNPGTERATLILIMFGENA